MTKIRFLHIVLYSMILSEIGILFYLEMLVKMYKSEYEIETIVFIKFNKTGAANVHTITNVFIFA